MRKESEALKLRKRFNVSQEDIAKSLASDFVCSFFINKNTGRFIEFSSSEIYKSLNFEATGDDFFSTTKNGLLSLLYPDDYDIVNAAITRENVIKVLSIDKSLLLNFRVIIQNRPLYVELKIVDMIGDKDHIVCGVRNIDAHMRRLEEYEKQRKSDLTFSGIAQALASDYDALVYVDTKNDQYKEYATSPKYNALNIPREGDSFLNGKNGLCNYVFIDDLPLFKTACNKENILKVLSVDKSFSITIRIMLNDEPTYCLIKATKMMLEDEYHVVIGLSDIDERVKREENYNKSINEVKEIAYRDPLTGVKSKHAYMEAERQIDEDIKDHNLSELAILVCDVNGLKKINDSLGHKAGDNYIKEASTLICKTYKHSPVYRIGGDEFVVILEGSDYIERDELLSEINHQIEENHPKGEVSISIGMSSLNKSDSTLHDVFERADKLMYERKKALKAERV